MPPKDPELVSLRKELEDLIAKCQVNTCKSMCYVRICLLLLKQLYILFLILYN